MAKHKMKVIYKEWA